MKISRDAFLESQWMTASLGQVGSPVPPNCLAGEHLITLPDGSYSCAPDITVATLGQPAPDCGPKARAVIGANGDWTCQPIQQGGGSSIGLLVLLGVGGYLAWNFYKDYTKRHKGRGGDDDE